MLDFLKKKELLEINNLKLEKLELGWQVKILRQTIVDKEKEIDNYKVVVDNKDFNTKLIWDKLDLLKTKLGIIEVTNSNVRDRIVNYFKWSEQPTFTKQELIGLITNIK